MNLKEHLVRAIGDCAWEQVSHLSGQLIRAESEHKEQILAELDFAHWLAETSDLSLG